MPTIITGIEHEPVTRQQMTIAPACGAECDFVGYTRAETHETHGRLLRLEYEAYEPMAAQLLQVMAEEAAARFDCHAVRLVHAVGPVPIGQASIVIQVICGHRGASFAACRYLIERVKAELPVWKREIWERGETFAPGFNVQASDPT